MHNPGVDTLRCAVNAFMLRRGPGHGCTNHATGQRSAKKSETSRQVALPTDLHGPAIPGAPQGAISAGSFPGPASGVLSCPRKGEQETQALEASRAFARLERWMDVARDRLPPTFFFCGKGRTVNHFL
jgi:hypothetical protein